MITSSNLSGTGPEMEWNDSLPLSEGRLPAALHLSFGIGTEALNRPAPRAMTPHMEFDTAGLYRGTRGRFSKKWNTRRHASAPNCPFVVVEWFRVECAESRRSNRHRSGKAVTRREQKFAKPTLSVLIVLPAF
jgi:hypothetical protein